MKTTLTLFIFSLFVLTSKAQWVELDPGVNVPYFSDVYAITPDIVVVVGANGTILKTTDGGETWVQKPSGTTENLRKVQFPTPDIGYAVAAGDALLKTTDGGETWEVVDVEADCYFYDFSCVDENSIFISCSGNLMKSQDGGEVWNNIGSLPGAQMQFLSNDIGFIYNELTFSLLKTDNGGGVWNEITGLAPFYFLDENNGFYYSWGLYKTIDGGNNFLSLGFGEWGLLTEIYAVNENNVWGILMGLLDGDPSSRGIVKILPTEPYSETIAWDSNPEIDMFSIHFANKTTGYIAGFKQGKGAIWKNGTGINTMATSENEFSDKIKVYPNPASNELNIVFENSEKSTITLSDFSGKQIYSKTINTNKSTINTQGFPKGTYILSVKTGNKYFTKKIIIN